MQLMSNEQLDDLHATKAQDRKVVELGEALARLRGNRDFQRVIEEGYLRDEAVRLVLSRSEPALQSAEKQAAILTAIDGIASLNSYLVIIRQQAEVSARNIQSTDREIEYAENE